MKNKLEETGKNMKRKDLPKYNLPQPCQLACRPLLNCISNVIDSGELFHTVNQTAFQEPVLGAASSSGSQIRKGPLPRLPTRDQASRPSIEAQAKHRGRADTETLKKFFQLGAYTRFPYVKSSIPYVKSSILNVKSSIPYVKSLIPYVKSFIPT